MRVSLFIGTLFLLCAPAFASAANLSLSPASGSHEAGSTFSVRVVVSTSGTSINAVSGLLSYTTETLSVQSISKSGSLINFWATEPTFSNSQGTVAFEGVSLGSGYTGSNGTVVTVVFKAIATGGGTITFRSGSVLANDGSGTDVTGTISGGSYTITPASAKKPSVEKPSVKESEEVATTTEPLPPSLSLRGEGKDLMIVGTSGYPDSDAVLTFIGTDDSSFYVKEVSDDKGSFSVPVPKILRGGAYAVTAVMTAPDGEKSPVSTPLTIQIGETVVIDIGWRSLAYIGLGVALFLALLAGYLFWFGYVRVKGITKKFNKEMKEAQVALKKSFAVLEADVAEHLKAVKKRGEGGEEDKEAMQSLKDDLKEAEAYIEKEIKDIESP